jgi:predicted nucleic acid-binding protein
MTIDYIHSKKFKGIVVDTNLLILLLIGFYDLDEIEKNKRLKNKGFEKEDFHKLVSLIDAVSNKITITPNILTEVCNLTDNYNNETDYAFFEFIEEFIRTLEERNVNSNEIIHNNQTAFYKFGLSDSSITNLSKEEYLIITVDAPLYHFLISQNLPAINYTVFRLI